MSEFDIEDKLIFLFGFLKGLRSKLKPDDQKSIDKVCEMLKLEELYRKSFDSKEEVK